MPALVKASAKLAKRYYGLVYPRDGWWFKVAASFMNFWQWVFRNPYRMFVHSTQQVEELLGKAGLKRVYQKRNWLWQVALYAR
jgi:hypothetical protein